MAITSQTYKSGVETASLQAYSERQPTGHHHLLTLLSKWNSVKTACFTKIKNFTLQFISSRIQSKLVIRISNLSHHYSINQNLCFVLFGILLQRNSKMIQYSISYKPICHHLRWWFGNKSKIWKISIFSEHLIKRTNFLMFIELFFFFLVFWDKATFVNSLVLHSQPNVGQLIITATEIPLKWVK